MLRVIISFVKKTIRIIRGTIGSSIIYSSAVTYIIVHTGWRLFSIFLPRRWFYKVEDQLWGTYQKMVLFFFEHSTGVKLYISGDIPKCKENVVTICNHQCTMDWIVMNMVAVRQGMIGNMRYVFKNAIKYLPLYGYAFGVHGGIYVKRDGGYNEKHMREILNDMKQLGVDMYFIIFPEGTRYNKDRGSVIQKSINYAEKNNLEPLKYVLTPRGKGFYCSIQSLKNYATSINDITIIYDYQGRDKTIPCKLEAPDMWRFLTSENPQIFIHFERVPISEVSDLSENETFRWLHKRFHLKDELIAKYFGLQKNNNGSGIVPEFKFSPLPLLKTLPSSLFYSLSTFSLLYHPEGRKIYATTLLGGSMIGMAYAKMFL